MPKYHSSSSKNQVSKSKPEKLSSLSKRDKVWDIHKRETVKVSQIYSKNEEFQRYAERTNNCANFLSFNRGFDLDTGEIHFKFKGAEFCHCRNCPQCQDRRAKMYKARFLEGLIDIERAFPKHRWIFLTLTVKNPLVSDLKASLGEMNKSWKRLLKRKEFEVVEGFIRATEVTMPKDRHYAHPHFHALLLVPEKYFQGKYYISSARWGELWQECARLDYLPSVKVKAVTEKRKWEESEERGLGGAVAELLKYSVKSNDMTASPEWFYELTRQTHGLRFISSGGALKNILKETQKEKDDDFTLAQENGSGDDGSRLGFKWDMKKHYRRYQKNDRPPQKI